MARHGITVLEVIVLLAIGIFGVGLVVLLVARTRESAQTLQCRNNLREIGKAFHAYHDASSVDEYLRSLPPSRLADEHATWPVLLAPHLVKKSPLHHWDMRQSYFMQQQEVREARLFVYFCPTRTRTDTLSVAGDLNPAKLHFPGALGDFAAVAGDGGTNWTGPEANGAIVPWPGRTSLPLLVRGAQNTLLAGDKHVPRDHHGDAACGDGSFYNGAHFGSFVRVVGPGYPLARSLDDPFNHNFGSDHRNVCNFLMADGSVRAIATDDERAASEAVLGRLARRGD